MLQPDAPQTGGRLPDVPQTEPAVPRPPWLRLAVFGLVAAAAALAVVSLPGLDEVQVRLAGADAAWLAAAAALEAGSCAAYVVAFRGIMCPRLPWRFSLRVGLAIQGANVLVPTGGAGGLALAAWALSRAGMSARSVARRTVTLFVATSSVNFLTALLGGTLLALGAVAGDVPAGLSIGPAGAALVLVVAVALVPRALDRFGARLRGRVSEAARRAVADGLRDVAQLPRRRRFGAIAGAVGYMFLDLAALAAAFAAVGDVPAMGVLLVAYPLGQLGGLVPLPGGAGGTDGALIAAFALYGAPLATAAAAVLAYRLFQLGLPAILAAPAIGGTVRTVKRLPAAAAGCEPARAAA